MDEFVKYQHIERWGTDEVEGINIGTCYVFPKLDGTNGCIWLKDGQLTTASRRNELSLENDNHGFCKWAQEQNNIHEYLSIYPNIHLFGEWLVPHTLKTYNKDAWRRFYVFDIWDNYYLPYDKFARYLWAYSIDYIPPICIITNPTYEQLIPLLDKATFMIEDGKGTGEGIVIKNYDFRNKYGRQTWAKIVRNEFVAQHGINEPTKMKGRKTAEEDIVNKFFTKQMAEKVLYNITAGSGWNSKLIPRLLNTTYHDFVNEEVWNWVKEFKNPVVDFKQLQQHIIYRIKNYFPELF